MRGLAACHRAHTLLLRTLAVRGWTDFELLFAEIQSAALIGRTIYFTRVERDSSRRQLDFVQLNRDIVQRLRAAYPEEGY